MITEDKITEIFCIADDFCKVFDVQMEIYSTAQSSIVPVFDEKLAPIRCMCRVSAAYGLAYPMASIWSRACLAVPSSLNSKI